MRKEENKAKPFLKWAGGKTQLLSEIANKMPFDKNDTFTFIEPFVGSGAVFFWILNNYPNIDRAVVNDINSDLTNCYKTIKNNVKELIGVLLELENEYNSMEHNSDERKNLYYLKRNLFNERSCNLVEQSALFIFLNRTCFNGLYRVNRKNEFNVPQGSYKKPQICNRENLLLVSELLQKVEILNGDFTHTKKDASSNSFFYFDPPYKPLSETSSFNSYAKDEFNDAEQIRLKEFCDTIDILGSKWVLSNSDVKGKNPDDNFFDNLYVQCTINRVFAKRSMDANFKEVA